jgi:hypothetical protein
MADPLAALKVAGPMRAILTTFLNSRPRHFLEPHSASDNAGAGRYHAAGRTSTQLRWLIENPADVPIQIVGLSIFPNRRSLWLADDTADSGERWLVYRQVGQFKDYIAPGGKKVYYLSSITCGVWLLVWWHRNRLLNLRFPMIQYVSPGRIAAINREIQDIQI